MREKVTVFPSLDYEHAYHGQVVCGVDEAGRGPWAGEVVAAAVILDAQRIPAGIHDSKKLSHAKREKLYDAIIGSCRAYAIASASVEEIDTLNILGATMLAMTRAVQALTIAPTIALVDGNRSPRIEGVQVRTIVKGDSLSLSIAAASILAKVHRDRQMQALDTLYPQYGFASHAGYGTKQHQLALARHGVTPHHRRSFAPIRAMLASAAA
jgi:ribonuclease HII